MLLIFCQDHQNLIDDLVAQKTDPNILAMVKEMVDNQECCGQTKTQSHTNQDTFAPIEQLGKKLQDKTQTTKTQPILYIFMSYSVPKSLWQELWSQQALHPFQFIIRGLPQNSFKALSEKVMDYQCPVTIHPDLFYKYQITQVPAFVMVEGNKHRTVYGSVSLEYALNALKKDQKITK